MEHLFLKAVGEKLNRIRGETIPPFFVVHVKNYQPPATLQGRYKQQQQTMIVRWINDVNTNYTTTSSPDITLAHPDFLLSTN